MRGTERSCQPSSTSKRPIRASVARLADRHSAFPGSWRRRLVARGIRRSRQQPRRFLAPSLDRDWLDPYVDSGLGRAVADALEAAMRRGRAHRRIRRLRSWTASRPPRCSRAGCARWARNADAVHSPPLRGRLRPVRRRLSNGACERSIPGFIVTVDCGISCKRKRPSGIRHAGAEAGHHRPSRAGPIWCPSASLVADPKCGPDCESAVLAGVGVALKLVQALGGRLGSSLPAGASTPTSPPWEPWPTSCP